MASLRVGGRGDWARGGACSGGLLVMSHLGWRTPNAKCQAQAGQAASAGRLAPHARVAIDSHGFMMGWMILAAGLNPAWQQIMVLDQLQEGEVNRARTVHWGASGKVLNVGVALHHLGAASRTLSIVGGYSGQAIRAALADLSVRWVESAAPTRICTTLLDQSKQQTTELVENAAPVQPIEVEAFLAAFEAMLRKTTRGAQTNAECQNFIGHLAFGI